MKFACSAFVSLATAALIRKSAADLGLTTVAQASLMVEAAARLYDVDRTTSAVPMIFRQYLGPIEVRLELTATAVGTIARISGVRGMSQEIVLANILADGAKHHTDPAEKIAPAFAPRRWKPAPIIHDASQGGSLTARIMGDPGSDLCPGDAERSQ